MQITIYRGTHEIGGTLVELKSENSRILIDAGYPIFLNNQPIGDEVSSYSYDKLLEVGVLPHIKGLYSWDKPGFDAVVISHAHIDHYGLAALYQSYNSGVSIKRDSEDYRYICTFSAVRTISVENL